MWIIPKPITSAFVPDTGALISDLGEQSHAFAQSLIQRSKVTHAPTWLRRLRQDSWTQLLSGRMLRASHTDSFTAAYTSSLGATPANHSQPLGIGLEKTTPAISGLGSQMELLSCAQPCASLKTSRGTLPLGCVTCSTTWESWVTERRGEYSRRLKLALLTRGRESSSWPTSSARDWKGCYTTLQRKDGKMRGDLLPDAVNIEEMHGRHALEKNSLDGSRPELWRTPNSQLIEAKPDGIKLTNRTPKDPQVGLADQVKAWSTPRSGKTTDENPETWAKRQEKGDVSTMPLTAQVKVWPTPAASTGTGGPHGLDGGSGARSMLPTEMKNSSGSLNPRWVETLMGVPVGWTMATCSDPLAIEPMNSGFSATASSQPQQP